MKNRYIPFGYQIQNGDSVINTEQAATVQHIFYAYTEGQSFKEIAEYLTTSGTAYHFSDNSWNKNIVARILANEIYCGAKGYAAGEIDLDYALSVITSYRGLFKDVTSDAFLEKMLDEFVLSRPALEA